MLLSWIARCLLMFASIVGADVNARDHDLVGAWHYVGEVNRHADGTLAEVGPLGHYDGLLIYANDGFMSIVLMPSDRHWRIDSATKDEFRETIEAGTAYAGRYEVDVSTGTVTHLPTTILDPAEAGKRLVRHYALTGDTLVLSGQWPYHGETLTFELTWRRAR